MKHSKTPKENLVSTRKQLEMEMKKLEKAGQEFTNATCKWLDAQMDFIKNDRKQKIALIKKAQIEFENAKKQIIRVLKRAISMRD